MTDLAQTIANERNIRGNLQRATVSKSFTASAISIAEGKIEVLDMPTILEHASITGGFILGHPDYGILGTSTLGGTLTYVVSKISNPNNKWVTFLTSKEMDYWKDTTETTGTVNTTALQLEFGPGKTFQTKTLSTESTNITKATLFIPSTAGTGVFTYKLSADDGTSFDTVTPAKEHIFSTAGTNIKINIGVAGSTANIDIEDSVGNKTPIKIEYS